MKLKNSTLTTFDVDVDADETRHLQFFYLSLEPFFNISLPELKNIFGDDENEAELKIDILVFLSKPRKSHKEETFRQTSSIVNHSRIESMF